MMGTLAAALAGHKIPTPGDRFRAAAEGDIRAVDGILKITDIRVRYSLTVSPEQEADARLSFENYIEKCPAAQSVTGCIRIAHELALERP
jgi:organic hydroperoxide reductase OsmC/OhrA